jgi:hypothetical protein
MKLSRWVLVGLLGLMACSITRPHGVTPISPIAQHWPTAVETLQPTFRWKPAAEGDVRYDFIILEDHPHLRHRFKEVVGREVYYREGLQEPEHTLEVSLQPDREYWWSVRVRHGQEVSEWSGAAHYFEGWSVNRWDEPFFRFRTPSK